jgi:alpha-L-rhamnosidase
MRCSFSVFFVLGMMATARAAENPATAEYLRCEYRVNPLGIDVTAPRLSWEMHDARRGAAQTAYQILVASTPEKLAADQGDLWDSGKVVSDQTAQIVYAGKPLQSRMECFWKVRLWDADGKPSTYSKAALWSMGLLKPEDVKAKWIGVQGPMIHPDKGPTDAKSKDVLGCPLFRKQFTVEKPIRRATLYASALGNYALSINGQSLPVADFFNPGWTDYRKRVYYNTYDVTRLVHKGGRNAIGAVLAAGWYAGAIGFKSDRFIYGRDPRLFVQLELEADDGSIQTIATDGSWKTAWGPWIEGEFLAGETYDARKEMRGWDSPEFNDAAWESVAVTDRIEAQFQAIPTNPVRVTGFLKPVKVTQQRPGVYVFDMGQNFAGFAVLHAKGPAGTKIVLRFAEMLNPDGSIYTTNLRGARCTDTYVLSGKGEETWAPQFTFHGFRYLEMTGYPGTPAKSTILGVAINSATPMVGSFECSSPMVNKLYSNICWTQRANFISIPTDCPQRDERLGWTGDAEVFCRAATYNADVASFFTKWLVDLEDAQQPDGGVTDVAPFVLNLGHGTAAWADAGTICPATIYWVYNDKRLLEKHYGMMVRLVEFDRKHSKDLLRPAEGYGDWLSIKADTPKDVIGTAFFAESTHLTAQAARVLGKEADARKYQALFEDIKRAFNKAYVAPDGRIKGNTQTCYVMALYFNLLPEDKRPLAAKYLVEDIAARGGCLSTGFVGTSMLMPVLAQTGHQDVAYRLLLNETFPSWGYSIKHGATSIWERWDGWTAEKGFQDPGMNSFAHYSFGAVARWMFQSVAGIDTDGPGYKRLLIRPQLPVGAGWQPAPLGQPGLSWVKASYRSLHGRIATEWRTEGGKFALGVTIPANTIATVSLPAAGPERVREGERPAAESEGVKFLRTEPGRVLYEVRAGTYRFVVP